MRARIERSSPIIVLLILCILSSACDGSTKSEPRLAFVSNRDGHEEIYLVNADGSGLVRLTESTGRSKDPAWSPDASVLAFTSDRDGDWDIYVMDIGEGQVTRLTDSPGSDVWPVWSPDGRKLAFVSDRDGQFEVYTMDVDGANQVRLTHSEGGMSLFPAWSSGNEIAVATGKADQISICLMGFDGSDVRCPVPGSRNTGEPRWSPAGKQIVFQWGHEYDVHIYVIETNTNRLQQLTRGSLEGFPVWSPDGNRIAYICLTNLCIMDSDGTDQVQMGQAMGIREPPAWSPDSKKIAFASVSDGDEEIYVIDIDGSRITKITDNDFSDTQPVWAPQ